VELSLNFPFIANKGTVLNETKGQLYYSEMNIMSKNAVFGKVTPCGLVEI